MWRWNFRASLSFLARLAEKPGGLRQNSQPRDKKTVALLTVNSLRNPIYGKGLRNERKMRTWDDRAWRDGA